MKVTNDFSYWEFGPKGCAKTWVPDNKYQKILIDNLAQNLQVIKDRSPVKLSIRITSGIRTVEDFYRLQCSGHNPSETSDHFYGVAVPIKNTSIKYKKFGSTYNFSIGAADCVPIGMDVHDFFIHSMMCHNDNIVKFGQIIYEKDPLKKTEWVHFGGYYPFYFSKEIVSWLDKKPFLKSIDGGKTYTVASL